MHALEKHVQASVCTCCDRDSDRSGEVVTTVYEEVRKCPASAIASCIIAAEGRIAAKPSGLAETTASSSQDCARRGASFRDAAWSLALRRSASMLSLLEAIGPDLEASALPPIDLIDQAKAGALSKKPWSHVLGRRIVLPAETGPEGRAETVTKLLLDMSYI